MLMEVMVLVLMNQEVELEEQLILQLEHLPVLELLQLMLEMLLAVVVWEVVGVEEEWLFRLLLLIVILGL